MSKTNDVIERAYGHIPKECLPNIEITNFVPTWRGIRYYWLILIRKFTR